MNSDQQRGGDHGIVTTERATAQRGVVLAFPDRRPVAVECGSGWYHEAAIKEAAQPATRRQ